MKTIILTQKKYSVSLKDSSTNLDKFIAEMFLLAKTLKEEKEKGMKLSQAAINPVDQTIEVTVTADANTKSSENNGYNGPSQQLQQPNSDSNSRQQGNSFQNRPRTMPPRPNR